MSKSASYRNFCEKIETLDETSRLVKVLEKRNPAKPESLRNTDGTFTETKAEALGLSLEIQFPGNQIITRSQLGPHPQAELDLRQKTRRSWYITSGVATDKAIRYAVPSFDGFKSPGTDGIYEATGYKPVTANFEKNFHYWLDTSVYSYTLANG